MKKIRNATLIVLQSIDPPLVIHLFSLSQQQYVFLGHDQCVVHNKLISLKSSSSLTNKQQENGCGKTRRRNEWLRICSELSGQAKPNSSSIVSSNVVRRLTLATVDLGVLALPVLGTGASLGLGELVSLAETTGLASGGGQTTHLAMLVDGVANPVEIGIGADGLKEQYCGMGYYQTPVILTRC